MDVFDLTATLSLDTSAYERSLNTAKATTGRSTADMTARVDKLKKGMLIGAGAMAAGFAAFGVSAVKTGAQFDSSMSQVAATMGKTNEEVAQDVQTVDLAWGQFTGNLRDYAQEMGAHTKFSATEAADALNYMALAGYDTQKSMEMLPNVLNLAAAGNMELAQASDMVTDASSALGLSSEETTQLVDKMAMASSKSNTSVAQLGEGMLTVGGTAKQLKGGTTELSTALGILADNGIKGAEGGTILRNAILSLSSPSSKAQKELDALGVSVFDSEGNMRSLDDIMGDLNSSMSNLTAEERAEAMSKIFNKRDLKGIEALLAGAGDRWGELSGYIDEAQGSAQKMADTQMDNLSGDVELMKSAWEGFKIQMSDQVTPALRKVVKGLTKLIDHADILVPIILGAATAFTVFAVASNIGTIISTTTRAVQALNGALLANPIVLIVALIAGLIVAFIALYKNNEKVRKKIQSIWKSIKKVFSKVFSEIKSAAKSAWSKIKSNIITPVQEAYAKAKSIVNDIKGALSSAWSSIKSTASSAWEGVKKAITDPIGTARDTVKKILKKIKGFFPLKIGKIFSGMKLPHFSVSGKAPFGIGGKGEKPSISVSWYRKAEQMPYMFSNATLFGAGEGTQDEILYGRNSLMEDIRKATGGGGDIVINLNYTAGDDANQMVRDIAKGVRRYRMAGAF